MTISGRQARLHGARFFPSAAVQMHVRQRIRSHSTGPSLPRTGRFPFLKKQQWKLSSIELRAAGKKPKCQMEKVLIDRILQLHFLWCLTI
jgi:hypothetical protein